jgi:hypothetical protein
MNISVTSWPFAMLDVLYKNATCKQLELEFNLAHTMFDYFSFISYFYDNMFMFYCSLPQLEVDEVDDLRLFLFPQLVRKLKARDS